MFQTRQEVKWQKKRFLKPYFVCFRTFHIIDLLILRYHKRSITRKCNHCVFSLFQNNPVVQWSALNWSCDLRANVRPWKKLHGEGTTYIHTNKHMDIATTGPTGENPVNCEWWPGKYFMHPSSRGFAWIMYCTFHKAGFNSHHPIGIQTFDSAHFFMWAGVQRMCKLFFNTFLEDYRIQIVNIERQQIIVLFFISCIIIYV